MVNEVSHSPTLIKKTVPMPSPVKYLGSKNIQILHSSVKFYWFPNIGLALPVFKFWVVDLVDEYFNGLRPDCLKVCVYLMGFPALKPAIDIYCLWTIKKCSHYFKV